MKLTVCPRCGKQLTRSGGANQHIEACFAPRTLGRLRELLDVQEVPCPSHVALSDCWLPGNGRIRRPYRTAYEVVHGEIPEDKPYVLHHCDNNPCFNPDHIYAGTQMDNYRDSVMRSRRGSWWSYLSDDDKKASAERFRTIASDVEHQRRAARARWDKPGARERARGPKTYTYWKCATADCDLPPTRPGPLASHQTSTGHAGRVRVDIPGDTC